MVEADLPEERKLSKLNILMMFFRRIRLNLTIDVLVIMYIETKMLVHWPERDVCTCRCQNLSKNFLKRAVIDYCEIFVERPADLKARAQAWSNYKHHSTVKFSFVSKCAGG